MLKADKLKLRIIELLKQQGSMTLGELKKKLNVAHHYTLTRSLEFLEKMGLIKIEEKGDKLRSKVVRVR